MSSGKIIIHIGLHKTATTYLQYHFFPRLSGVRYIHGGSFFNQWQSQARNTNEDLLLSYEGFSGLAWNAAWLRGDSNDFHWLDSFAWNMESLRRFFPNSTIVVFFRRHGDILLSMYKQYVQEGGTLPLSSFYGHNAVIRPEDLSFRLRIELIRNYFPTSFLLNYEDYKKIGDSYIKDFFSQEFNLSICTKAGDTKSLASNNSITGSKLEILRSINRYYQKWPTKIKSGLRYAGWSPRDILQNKLNFWKPRDPEEFQLVRDQVNDYFKADWEYFLEKQWVIRIRK